MTDWHEGSRGQRARKAQARSVPVEFELFCLCNSAAAGQLVLLGTVVPDDDGGRRISRMVKAGAGAAVALTSADRPLDAASSARGQFHGQGQRELSSISSSLQSPWSSWKSPPPPQNTFTVVGNVNKRVFRLVLLGLFLLKPFDWPALGSA